MGACFGHQIHAGPWGGGCPGSPELEWKREPQSLVGRCCYCHCPAVPGEQAEALPGARAAGERATGSAAGVVMQRQSLGGRSCPGMAGWSWGRRRGLVQVCSHPSSPALGEGTGWHGSLQGYPRPALLLLFHTPAPPKPLVQLSSRSFSLLSVLRAVCAALPERGMFQLSRRCPPCGRWLHCVPLISLSGAGEPGPALGRGRHGLRNVFVVPGRVQPAQKLGAHCRPGAWQGTGAQLQAQSGRGRQAWTWCRAADMARSWRLGHGGRQCVPRAGTALGLYTQQAGTLQVSHRTQRVVLVQGAAGWLAL